MWANDFESCTFSLKEGKQELTILFVLEFSHIKICKSHTLEPKEEKLVRPLPLKEGKSTTHKGKAQIENTKEMANQEGKNSFHKVIICARLNIIWNTLNK